MRTRSAWVAGFTLAVFVAGYAGTIVLSVTNGSLQPDSAPLLLAFAAFMTVAAVAAATVCTIHGLTPKGAAMTGELATGTLTSTTVTDHHDAAPISTPPRDAASACRLGLPGAMVGHGNSSLAGDLRSPLAAQDRRQGIGAALRRCDVSEEAGQGPAASGAR